MRGRPPNNDAEMEEDIRANGWSEEQMAAILSRYYSLRRKGMEAPNAAVQSMFDALDAARQRVKDGLAEIDGIIARN